MSVIYQNFKDINFSLEKASNLYGNISRQHVTYFRETRKVIYGQRYNNFSLNSIRIFNQFEKVHPNASPTNGIFRLNYLAMKLFLFQREVEEFF